MNYNNTHNDGINYMDQFKYPINLQKYSSKRNNNDKARCALPEVWLHSTTTIKCNVKTSITVTVMAVIASTGSTSACNKHIAVACNEAAPKG